MFLVLKINHLVYLFIIYKLHFIILFILILLVIFIFKYGFPILIHYYLIIYQNFNIGFFIRIINSLEKYVI